MANQTIDEFIFRLFNTLKLDGKTLDGRPYEPGVNLPGPRIPQYYWDYENDRNELEPRFHIEPCERLVSGKSKQFYELIFKGKEVFMAGSRGTAKTFDLLMSHAIKRISWNARGIKNQNTAMFAITKDMIESRHFAEMDKVFPPWVGTLNKTKMTFTFADKWFGGGTIFFLYSGQRDAQIRRLLSLNLSYITWEELCENSKAQYDWTLSLLRSSLVPEAELCIASASNSGGRGHKWVNARWLKPKNRKELNKEGAGLILQKRFPYENPTLPRGYWDKLALKLTPKWRKAWIENNWDIYEGQYFDMIDEEIHFLPKRRSRDEIVKYLAIDHGAGSHPTGAILGERYKRNPEWPKGKIIISHYYELKDKFSSNHKKNIWKMLGYNTDGTPIVPGQEVKNIQFPSFLSHDAFSNKASTEGDLTVAERYNEDDKYGRSLECIRSDKSPGIRAIGWKAIADLLAFEDHYEEEIIENEDGSIVKVRVRIIDSPPQLYFLDTPENRRGVEELTALVESEDKPGDAVRIGANDYDEFEGDEFPDALRMLVMGMGEGGVIQIADDDEGSKRYDPLQEMLKNERGGGRNSITMGDFVG
jgi:hypothetical protein